MIEKSAPGRFLKEGHGLERPEIYSQAAQYLMTRRLEAPMKFLHTRDERDAQPQIFSRDETAFIAALIFGRDHAHARLFYLHTCTPPTLVTALILPLYAITRLIRVRGARGRRRGAPLPLHARYRRKQYIPMLLYGQWRCCYRG